MDTDYQKTDFLNRFSLDEFKIFLNYVYKNTSAFTEKIKVDSIRCKADGQIYFELKFHDIKSANKKSSYNDKNTNDKVHTIIFSRLNIANAYSMHMDFNDLSDDLDIDSVDHIELKKYWFAFLINKFGKQYSNVFYKAHVDSYLYDEYEYGDSMIGFELWYDSNNIAKRLSRNLIKR